MEAHLQKIKDLLKLATSSNDNEAATAKFLADKLIAKYEVTPDQLADIEASDKPIYDDDDLLLDTEMLADWINILALVVCKKYDCFAIKEDNIASDGPITYRYYVYGDPADVAIAKQLFNFVYDRINKLLAQTCSGRGQLYRDSFAEGAVNGARVNIEYENFSTIGVVKVSEEKSEVKKDAIEAPQKTPLKPPAIENKVNVSNKEKPLDVYAYFQGMDYGSDIHIGSIDESKLPPSPVIDINKFLDF